jgi:hypothetical protein
MKKSSIGGNTDINVVPVEDTAIAVDGLKQEDPTHDALMAPYAEPVTSPKTTRSPAKARSQVKETADPRTGMAARNNRVRKAPKKYVPSTKGNKYAIVLTQITSLLCGSKDALSMAQRLVKLMGKGLHRHADIVGMIMAQMSMKAALKKWGKTTEQAITIEMRQLHWRNSYKPMHLHELTNAQKLHILESHIFVEEKRDGKIKARKVVGRNNQRDYTTKEDVSSPTVLAEAVMLTCVIDAHEDHDVAVIDIPNAFVQTLVMKNTAYCLHLRTIGGHIG